MWKTKTKASRKEIQKKNRDKQSGIEEKVLKNPFMTSERWMVSRQIL